MYVARRNFWEDMGPLVFKSNLPCNLMYGVMVYHYDKAVAAHTYLECRHYEQTGVSTTGLDKEWWKALRL